MLKITFINVGYGDAILLELIGEGTPYTVLVDGGSGGTVAFLQKLDIRRIDLLVCTHFHVDHVGGLVQVAAQCEIGAFWGPCQREALPEPIAVESAETESARLCISGLNAYIGLLEVLDQKKVPITDICGIQQALSLRDGLSVDILGPNQKRHEALLAYLRKMKGCGPIACALDILGEMDAWLNQSSIILRFHYAGKKILLLSDADRDAITYLYETPEFLQADIVKLAHHGQADAMNERLAAAISPALAVTCVSSDRRYGSAHPSVYQSLTEWAEANRTPVAFGFSDAVSLDGQGKVDSKLGFEVRIEHDGSFHTKEIFSVEQK